MQVIAQPQHVKLIRDAKMDFKLNSALKAAIEQMAAQEGRTGSDFVLSLVLEALKQRGVTVMAKIEL
jgi:uncharacterized protein (DUF1778 family)